MRAQSGVALITAILVVALASIAATAVLVSASISIRRMENLQASELGWWYGVGVEAWVKTILQRDAEQNAYDGLTDVWAVPVDFLPIDEGALAGRVTDLQGCFNLNNLAVTDEARQKAYAQVLTQLLTRVGEIDEFQAQAIVAATLDWIDTDQEPQGFDGAEDSEYLGVLPPYRSANQLMASRSEWLAVKGMTGELYAKLRDLVCALPQTGTTINVNTAPAPLLQALTVEAHPELEAFLESREQAPAESKATVLDVGAFTAADPGSSMIDVSSQFFRSDVRVTIGSSVFTLYSFYFRPRAGIPSVYGHSTDLE